MHDFITVEAALVVIVIYNVENDGLMVVDVNLMFDSVVGLDCVLAIRNAAMVRGKFFLFQDDQTNGLVLPLLGEGTVREIAR